MKINGLTNNQLKIIAMLAMLFDHIGIVLFPQNIVFRIIGRIAFPIFAYMIAEGCTYTKSKTKYLIKMAGFALICQSVYSFVTGSLYQNILITFTLSVTVIFCIDKSIEKSSLLSGAVLLTVSGIVVFICLVAPQLLELHDFQIDYGLSGVLFPIAVYLAPTKREKIICAVLIMLLMGFVFGGVQWYALLSVPLLLLYNGKRGQTSLKHLFYIFYPTHLVVIYGISLLIKELL